MKQKFLLEIEHERDDFPFTEDEFRQIIAEELSSYVELYSVKVQLLESL